MQHWKKLGLIFQPDRARYWQRSHAALPTALPLEGDIYRIYFTSRDQDNRTYVGWFEFNILDPTVIIRVSPEPVLVPGTLGFFDDHGVQACSLVRNMDKIYLYYLGWSPGRTPPVFYTSMGLAISEDNGLSFQKYSTAPIMQRSQYDPWMVSGGTVLLEEGLWRMWYLSGQKIELTSEGARSWYDIKYAEADDGINWRRNGHICLPLQEGETNISRMSILRTPEKYRCWYPVKKAGMNYRIGYAESADGIVWTRLDQLAGIAVSSEGWDSQALDKQEVICHKGKLYMLYNGNRFGIDGIGMAILDNE